MEDKRVLGEFHAKISKAKILYDTTSATNQKLRRQANQLQRQYENLKNKRIETQQWQKDAQQRMNQMKNRHKQQNDRCRRETKQLDDARSNRKQFQRVKKICQSDLQTRNLQLQELIKHREELEATAKALTEKLNSTVSQKNVLQEQYAKTNKAIQKYDQNIKALTQEIRYAREVITTNTVPVHNIPPQQQSRSRQKNGKA